MTTMNKVIAMMMMLTITSVTPAMAGDWRTSHLRAAAKVERVKGVINTQWNPRTREMTVIYDARMTSPRNIKHFMA